MQKVLSVIKWNKNIFPTQPLFHYVSGQKNGPLSDPVSLFSKTTIHSKKMDNAEIFGKIMRPVKRISQTFHF